MKNKKLKQIPRIFNCLESTEQERDWTIDTALTTNILTQTALPQKVDLRENRWWKVGDQGATGSCVGWATADSVLRWHFVNNGMLKKKTLLSVRFLWMAAKETDRFNSRPSTFIESSGTSLKAALDIARYYGCVRDAILPFMSNNLYLNEENMFYSLASEFKIRGYFNLNNGNKIHNWKTWLAGGGGPILTRLNVDQNWMKINKQGKLQSYDYNTADGGHAVAIVGYRNDDFIVRNSWGTDWGHKGYAYASSEYAQAAFSESYGVKLFGQR